MNTTEPPSAVQKLKRLMPDLAGNMAAGAKEVSYSVSDILVICTYILKLEGQKEELLALVKGTAAGALETNKRARAVADKAIKSLGLARSIILGGERTSSTAEKMFDETIADLLQFSLSK